MSVRNFFMVLIILASGIAGPALAELRGSYKGIDDDADSRLEFTSGGDRIKGTFTDAAGARYPFVADRLESGAETVIDLNGRRAYMLFTEEPLGVTVLTIPVAPDGSLLSEETNASVYIDEAVATPPRPERYVPPPTGSGGVVDPRAFVESYSFWPSRAVAYGYDGVRGRYRTLIRLHAVVQTDIVWKMCRSGARTAALAEALRGQGTSCEEVLSAFGAMMQGRDAVAKFNRFRADVEAQKASLVEAIRCSIDYRRNDPACKAAGERVAKSAISLETVATVLGRY